MKRMLITLTLAALLAAPALADEPTQQDFDEFWKEEGEFRDDLLDGTGTGGGPMMVWFESDFDKVNAELEDAGLLAVPVDDLYWGGAAWFGINSGDKLYVALGGGGYGGGSEARRSDDFSRFGHGAGYFAAKGILPLHKRLFLEGGVQLGAGHSELLVERTDTDTGIVNVHLRGDRNFLLARASLGVDLRLARWIGILFAGGYALTSGDWSLEGERDLIDRLDFEDDSGPFASVMVRFGI